MFTLPEIGARIVADNHKNEHCTAHPIFVVQRRRRTWGLDSEYTETFSWFYGDENSELHGADLEAAERFFNLHFTSPKYVADGIAYGEGHSESDFGDAEFYSDLRRVGYVDHWENDQPFFTRAGAERYIEENGHNLKFPRIYVECAFRNREWQALRKWLMDAATPQTCTRTGPHDGPCNGFPAPTCTLQVTA